MLKGKYKNLRIYYKKSTNIENPKTKIQVIYFTVYQKFIIYEPLRNILLFDNIIFYFIKTRY